VAGESSRRRRCVGVKTPLFPKNFRAFFFFCSPLLDSKLKIPRSRIEIWREKRKKSYLFAFDSGRRFPSLLCNAAGLSPLVSSLQILCALWLLCLVRVCVRVFVKRFCLRVAVLFWFEWDWREFEFVRLGCVVAFGIGVVNRSKTVCVLVTVCAFLMLCVRCEKIVFLCVFCVLNATSVFVLMCVLPC